MRHRANPSTSPACTPKQINAPEAVLGVSEEGQPGWPTIVGHWAVVFGEDTPYKVLVDIDPERAGDLLGDPAAAKARLTLFQFNDSLDECR